MKLKTILLSTLSAVAIMFGTLAPTTSTMAAESQVIEIDDIEVTPEQLSDGVTVVLTKNEDGTFEQTVFTIQTLHLFLNLWLRQTEY